MLKVIRSTACDFIEVLNNKSHVINTNDFINESISSFSSRKQIKSTTSYCTEFSSETNTQPFSQTF